MANALKGTSSVFMVFIAPNDEAAAGVRIFFENHIEFMKEKSHQQGPLKLIQSTYSESPEWQNDGPYIAGPAPFFEGEFPAKTGRTVLVGGWARTDGGIEDFKSGWLAFGRANRRNGDVIRLTE